MFACLWWAFHSSTSSNVRQFYVMALAILEILMDLILRSCTSLEDMLWTYKPTEVMSTIHDVRLKLNPKKCFLFQRNVEYLGNVVSAEGLSLDLRKVN